MSCRSSAAPWTGFHWYSPRKSSFVHARVKIVPQAITENTDTDNDETEGNTGDRRNPPGIVEIVAPLRDGLAPGRLARRRTETEEAERRFGDDHQADFDRRDHDQRRDDR